jgi:hypothetical protein
MVEDFPKFKKAHNNHKLILYCTVSLMLGLVVATVIVIPCRKNKFLQKVKIRYLKKAQGNYNKADTVDPGPSFREPEIVVVEN